MLLDSLSFLASRRLIASLGTGAAPPTVARADGHAWHVAGKKWLAWVRHITANATTAAVSVVLGILTLVEFRPAPTLLGADGGLYLLTGLTT